MSAPDWNRLEADVVVRIRLLRATSEKLDAPAELREAIWRDLVMPNLRLLAEFCVNVDVHDEQWCGFAPPHGKCDHEHIARAIEGYAEGGIDGMIAALDSMRAELSTGGDK